VLSTRLLVMNIIKGDIVKSLSGRDKGRLFFVLDCQDDGYVLLADGDYRRLGNPKRKKIKHISHFSSADIRVAQKLKKGDSVTDAELRKAIRQLENPLCEGGL